METIGTVWLWGGFTAFVLVMLALDLGVFHRKAHEVRFREALTWSVVWVALALAFNALIWTWFGPTKGLEFLTGYLIEKALSVDNIFVFLVIFSYFAVPSAYQHRVLFWGILGALVMRAIFIAAGAALITKFHWIIYVFGGVLLLHRREALRAAERAHAAREEPGAPPVPAVRADRAGVPRAAIHRGEGGAALRHAAARRARAGRGDRPRVRRRLDPGRLRGHEGPVHRLHVEHLRHPRPARAVLPAGRA